MSVIHIDDNSFKKEVIESTIPVLVDFYADWCGPCKMVSPILEKIAEEYNGKIKICKLNVDDARNTAVNFGIMSIPTLIIFSKGQIVKNIIGAVPKDEIEKNIKAII